MEMQDMANVVEDINGLIAKYGLSVVKHALNYIDTFPVVKFAVHYKFNDDYGNTWNLDQAAFDRVDKAHREGKIQGIKTFREVTGAGLKEAKHAMELYYDGKIASSFAWT